MNFTEKFNCNQNDWSHNHAAPQLNSELFLNSITKSPENNILWNFFLN